LKNILIVGGTGFIGYHLSKKCLKKNFSVTSISTKKPHKSRYLKKVKYLFFDISKKKNFKKIKSKFQYVVNLSGYVDHSHKTKTFNSHFIGLKNLADFFLFQNIKKFIQFGSSVEYGFAKSPQNENYNIKANKLKSIYGKAKFLSSKYLIEMNLLNKFPVIIFRLYLTYGPNQSPNRLIPMVIKNALENNSFDCSDGNQLRDFIYIDDVTNAILLALKDKKYSGIYNLGSGKPVKVKNIIKKIIHKIKKGKPNFGAINLRKDEPKNLFPLINKIKKDLKWKPKIKLKKGLEKTINFYVKCINDNKKKHKKNI